ncbi:MAG: peptidoglycan DD-metalloendopeptidase family protein, partial [Peptococcaceae bacterium]|nr:peptidoglycan DD-metalloendopeptidase family protein [Peptococcaceae bacterium]
HLNKRNVAVDEKVQAGQVLGVEGNTGNVTGSHLHLELRKVYADRMTTIDPADYLKIKNKVGDVEMEKGTNAVSNWAKDAWKWAKEKGLLDGTRPQEPITREEMAVVLERVVNLK